MIKCIDCQYIQNADDHFLSSHIKLYLENIDDIKYKKFLELVIISAIKCRSFPDGIPKESKNLKNHNKPPCEEVVQFLADNKIPAELNRLIGKWTLQAQNCSDFQPTYYVKNASLVFSYNYVLYRLEPYRINATAEMFEYLSNRMQDDLVLLGAKNIRYNGMID